MVVDLIVAVVVVDLTVAVVVVDLIVAAVVDLIAVVDVVADVVVVLVVIVVINSRMLHHILNLKIMLLFVVVLNHMDNTENKLNYWLIISRSMLDQFWCINMI